MLVEQLDTGGDRNFGYLVADREGGRGALIDPSCRPGALLRRSDDLGLTVDYIFVTHTCRSHRGGEQGREGHRARVPCVR